MRALRNQSFWMGCLGCLVCFCLLELVKQQTIVKGQLSSRPTVAPSTDTHTPPPGDPAKRLIPFQAYLTDSEGNPLSGVHTLTFKFYDQPEVGQPLWTDDHQNVSVSRGMVNVLLGSREGKPIPPSLLFSEPRYIGIIVDNGPEMLPRQQVISSIHAVDATNAERARQLTIPGTLSPAVNVAANGNVGIGTTNPQAKLHIEGGGLMIANGLSVNDGSISAHYRCSVNKGGYVEIEHVGSPIAAMYNIAVIAKQDTHLITFYSVLFVGSNQGAKHVILSDGNAYVGEKPISASFRTLPGTPEHGLKLELFNPSEDADVYVTKIQTLW